MALLDSKKSEENILTDLINNANRSRPSFVPHPYGVLKFRNVTKARHDQDYDTIVEASNLPVPQDTDWVEFFYTRSSITAVLNRKPPNMTFKPAYTSLYAMLDDINAHFGINITEDTVEDVEIEADAFPITVPIHVKPTSLVYRGASAIYLQDPASGTGIITTGDTGLADVAAVFRDGNELLIGGDLLGTGFWVSENGEAQLAAAIFRAEESEALATTNGHFPVALAADQQWRYVFSLGLLNAVNGEDYYRLYRTTLTIRRKDPGAPSLADLVLTRAGGDYYLVDAGRNISLPCAQGFLNGRAVQGVLTGHMLKTILEGAALNESGGLLGGFVFEIQAARQGSTHDPVKMAISLETESVAKLTAYIATQTNTLQLKTEGSNEIDFSYEVRVSGPAGEAVSLKQAVDYTLEVTPGATVTFTPKWGITGDTTTLKIPNGLQKGYYPLTGKITLPLNWDHEAHPEIVLTLKKGEDIEAQAQWTLIAAPIVPTAPTETTAMVVNAMDVAGNSIEYTPGVYAGVPAPTVTVAFFVDGVETEVELDEEADGIQYFTIPTEWAGKSFELRETATNASGAETAVSATFGPVRTRPSIQGVTISGAPLEGETLTAAVTGVSLGVPAAEGMITWSADGEFLKDGAWDSAEDLQCTLTEAEVGKVIRAYVELTNSVDTVGAMSDPTAAVQGLTPVAPPDDSGNAAE